jgi:DNA-binding NtrC family response regulator
MMHFLDTLSPSGQHGFVFSGDAPSFLIRHPWPGNVRELRNLCERLTVVHTGKTVDAAFLTHLMEYRESTRPLRSGPRDMEEIERALAQAGGKITRAAEILGVHRATLWRKCKRLSQAENR